MTQRTRVRAATARAIAAAVSALALSGIAGCAGPSGGTGGPVVDASGSEPAGTARPGRYQTLPEPCGSVSSATLHDLLPGSANYAGTALMTFDTDRRVGCRWTGTAQGSARTLSVDFERVVSYDPSVSDDDQAGADFARLADAAHVPQGTPQPTGTASGLPDAAGSAVPSARPGTAPSALPSAASAAHSGSAFGTADASGANAGAGADDADAGAGSRRVAGVGDEAYLLDVPAPDGKGYRREVTFVFRAANVLVTIVFEQHSANAAGPPPSGPLEQGARDVAGQLARLLAG